LIWAAALLYVLAIASVLLLDAALNTAMVFFKHELHVGWLDPGRLMFSGRK
jgi:hypothetical protein